MHINKQKNALKEIITEIIVQYLHPKLNIYDFDSTLAFTKEKVSIVDSRGKEIMKLTPHEYAEYEKKPGEKADYKDFKRVTNAQVNKPVFDHFLKSVEKDILNTFILTARGSDSGPWIKKFLYDNDVDFPMGNIITLDSSDPHDKASWIKEKIFQTGIDHIFFCDDSIKNVNAVEDLNKDNELREFCSNLQVISKHITNQP